MPEPKDKTAINSKAREPHRRCRLKVQLPSDRTIPRCQRLPAVAGIDAALYPARVTDLTTETLKAGGVSIKA